METRFDALLFHLHERRMQEIDQTSETAFQRTKKPTAASDMCNDPLMEQGGNSTKAG
jgi:hypothetical protein